MEGSTEAKRGVVPQKVDLHGRLGWAPHDLGLRTPKETKDSLVVLKELLEAGKVTPVIDRTYPLSEVAEAIRYLEEGRASGEIVITV